MNTRLALALAVEFTTAIEADPLLRDKVESAPALILVSFALWLLTEKHLRPAPDAGTW